MSGLYTQLASRALFPLHERIKRHDSVARRRFLERSQWWTPAAVAEYQLARLRDFLFDVGRSVPYYRTLFRQMRFDPGTLRTVADLARLPLLEKRTIRANADAMKAEDAGPLARYNTGGSSGEPLVFYIGRDRRSHDVAAKWRATRWWGVDIGDPELVLWGSPIELGAQDRVRQARDRLLRTELVSAFELSPAALDRLADRIRRGRPRMLFGYPSALAKLASHARQRGVRLDDCGVAVAFVTAEKLYEDQRAAIAAAFGCLVANGYGGRDAGFIAHECPRGGLHLSAEDIVVEVVDAQGFPLPAGTTGEIVVTHLATRDFPFVRYRTGDVGTLSPDTCACGRGLPLLAEVQGRSTDFVVAADGTVMHGLALIYVLRDLPGIEAFRIVQESRRQVRVQLVANDRFDPAARAKLVAGLQARLGAEVEIVLDLVGSIPPERSGKYRYVVSHVGQDAA